MRTEIEALKEIRDRISYFCSRTDGKYDPPWAQEVIGIIDNVLIMPYRQCKRFGAPFYVEVGTSIVAIRCASNHDVVWRADHSVHGKATVDWAESVCTRMNQEAHKRELSKYVSKNGADFGQLGDAAKLREALENAYSLLCEGIATEVDDAIEHPFHLELACEKIQVALAAPPRNCDVGTAEEQSERMDAAYCSKRLCAKGKCPLFKPGLDCSLIWAQMPYEEGGGR